MRVRFERFFDRRVQARRRVLVLALAVLAPLAAASPALATSKVKEDFAPFADCPVESAAACVVATTTGGEFVLGHKAVAINKTITLQGGFATEAVTPQALVGAADGDTLSNTPLTVPGGLVGIEGLQAIGGEVTATAELAGPPSSIIINKVAFLFGKPDAVTLPLKVKLTNEVLGEECYVGSDAEPIVLHLTTGTTSPPFPGQPITGNKGTLDEVDRDNIRDFVGTSLVDNDFAVPGATGCGGSLSSLIDPILDADVGIPAEAGSSTAIMKGALEETEAALAKKYKPKQPKPKKAKK
jgi:hypothetical protein